MAVSVTLWRLRQHEQGRALMSVSVPEDLKQRLTTMARELGCSLSKLVEDALVHYTCPDAVHYGAMIEAIRAIVTREDPPREVEGDPRLLDKAQVYFILAEGTTFSLRPSRRRMPACMRSFCRSALRASAGRESGLRCRARSLRS